MTKTKARAGVEGVIEMFAVMEEGERNRLLGELVKRDPELAQKVRAGIFGFERLREIPARQLQVLWKEVPRGKIALALRKCEGELRAHLFASFSARAGEALREESEALGPQKLVDVQAAQREIAQTAWRLIQEGKLVVG